MVAKYPASAKSTSLISQEGTGIPTAPYWKNSGVRIVERLRERPEPDASATADLLEELSPTGLAVTLAAVRRARELPDLRAALAQEYGLVLWFASTQPDLLEGIRAQLIDKDRSPKWRPATIAELAPDAAETALAYVPPTPLWS